MGYVQFNDKEVVEMIYTMEFRRAAFKAHEEYGSSREVAELFGCSESWVRRLVQVERLTGSLEPRRQKMPDRRKLLPEDEAQLLELITRTPDMTLGELAAALEKKVSVATVWRAAERLQLPLKKSRSTPPSRTGRTSSKGAPPGSSHSAT